MDQAEQAEPTNIKRGNDNCNKRETETEKREFLGALANYWQVRSKFVAPAFKDPQIVDTFFIFV